MFGKDAENKIIYFQENFGKGLKGKEGKTYICRRHWSLQVKNYKFSFFLLHIRISYQKTENFTQLSIVECLTLVTHF